MSAPTVPVIGVFSTNPRTDASHRPLRLPPLLTNLAHVHLLCDHSRSGANIAEISLPGRPTRCVSVLPALAPRWGIFQGEGDGITVCLDSGSPITARAYYRSAWQSPTSCAVNEPRLITPVKPGFR